ncbi:hypothetical protein ACVIHI_009106 [Bradyrhizobium sp. USDA 4524]|uniref:hypothetical protein n=1 Tax=unclassified Bradyrhizobium TaxID=2631580 RepID=UPI0020A09109|nr:MULTISPECIES: hypothetical protein [unclassified Bradyrhizobium]MCP1846115.1 hypothetical protein [Bradyrhizobium sp. USDA 4538]MCP1907250.1 hypothetical protein [Bradyrhizobium sp. USDA 4537]MCP1985726.1 hypothetical protein [Bradyrhizobium sp. USDA 4539]
MTHELRNTGPMPGTYVAQEQPLRPTHQAERKALYIEERSPGEKGAEPSTSYAAMLAEAQDGDTSEALAVALGGARQRAVPELKDAVISSQPRWKTAKPVFRTEVDQDSANLLFGLRDKQNAERLGGESAIAHAGGARLLSVKNSHDQLMLTASQMRSSEAATHISYRAFLKLTKILSSSDWVRNVHCSEALLRSQMARVKGTAT